MSDTVSWLGWTVLGWLGLASPACVFWAGLGAAELEADPHAVVTDARRFLSAHLEAEANAAEWAITIDWWGARVLRRLTGFPPDPQEDAIRILGTAQMEVGAAWSGIGQRAATSGQARPPTADSGNGLVETISRQVESVTAAIAESVSRALRGDLARAGKARVEAPHTRSPAHELVDPLRAAHASIVAAHLGVRRLLLRSLFWSLLTWGGLAVGLASIAAAAAPAARTTDGAGRALSDAASLSRSAAVTSATTKLGFEPMPIPLPGAEGPAAHEPFFGCLLEQLVPEPVAGDLVRWFGLGPATPGSLWGHDRRRGGLLGHTLAVVRHMRTLTAAAPSRERALAATLAAAHDLGKLLAYRQDQTGAWAGHPAVPHDSLGAQALALCPSLTRAYSEEEREDLLLALSLEHAVSRVPGILPANCRPRVSHLLEWLREADGAAAAAADGLAATSTIRQERSTHA